MSLAPSILLRGAHHAAFMAVMIGSSGLAILRMTAVTALLPIASFGLYATLVAAGAFLSGPLSFGAIEATVKKFPRLVADGLEAELIADSDAILQILAIRAIAPATLAFAAGTALNQTWLLYLGCAILLAFSTAVSGLVASMQRGRMKPGQLASGTAIRAVLAAAAVSAAAFSSSLVIVLATEFVAVLCAAMFTRWYYFTRNRRRPRARLAHLATTNDGRLIFAAYTMIALPFYLDRSFVAASLGLKAAGQYGILAMFLMAASLLIATIGQRASPEAIILIHRGQLRAALIRTGLWAVFNTVAWLTFVATVWLIVSQGWLPPALDRYALTTGQLAPIAATGVLLNTGMLEFILIGLDREKRLAICAATFLGAVLISGATALLIPFDLIDLIWLLCAARLVYAAALLAAIMVTVRQISSIQAT